MIKAAIQGGLSKLPNPQRWNHLFQKYVTRSLDLKDDYFLTKWQQCETHIANYGAHAREESPSFIGLEIGTGWFPVSPIGMVLNGAAKFYTIDMQDLLKHECVVKTLERYHNHIQAGSVRVRRKDALDVIERLLARKDSLDGRELLAELGIECIIKDVRDSGLADDSIDLICSNNTLEHIPRNVIEEIFREFSRISSFGGIMSHHIDLSDHYVSFDPNINVYNFLRFSDREWRKFNNDLQYVNRLRVSDYREIHEECGWELEYENSISESIEELRKIPVHPQFGKYSEGDLAVYITWMVSTARRHA